jgi:tetratricopeptide (TPR) repeat protein
MVTPIAYGAIGDCYVELKRLNDAAKFYVKAAKYEKNDFTSPIFYKKAGMVYEELKQYEKALDLYNIIKNDFTKSIEARDIEKDIARLNVLMNK